MQSGDTNVFLNLNLLSNPNHIFFCRVVELIFLDTGECNGSVQICGDLSEQTGVIYSYL